jgi:RNA polymerase sigma-70 factor (ECF subfamily)
MARRADTAPEAKPGAVGGPGGPAGAEVDEVTLRRAQRGDEGACRAVVEGYQDRVFALIGRMVGAGRRAVIEDLAQETFLQVFRGLGGFSPLWPARLSTWILTIASRRAIDEVRRPVRDGDSDAEPVAVERADERVLRGEVGAAIERALAALGPEQRAAFLLREYHGLDYADIARALGVDVGTVKSRLGRARAALRAALAEVHHG